MQIILNGIYQLTYNSLVIINICYILNKFLNAKIISNKFILYLSVCSFYVLTFLYSFSDSVYTAVLQIITIFIFLFVLYGKNILRSLYIQVFYLLLETILQIPIIWLFHNICNLENNKILTIIITLSTSCVILALSMLVNFKFQRVNTVIELISVPIKLLILICLAATTFLMAAITAPILYDTEVLNLYQLEVFSIIAMFSIVAIIISLLVNMVSSKYYQNISKALSQQIDVQVKYYDSLRKSDEKIRGFRHDFKNHIMCIQNMIAHNQLDEVNNYINELSGYSLSYEAFFNTGNYITNGLFTEKNNIAMEQGIKLNFDGIIPSNGITSVDLCIIFSNALDNAIEACTEINDMITRIINVETKINNSYLFIKITNPTNHNSIIRGNCILTTKEDKSIHGFGLYNVNDVIKKYNGELKLISESNQFVFDASIKLESTIPSN